MGTKLDVDGGSGCRMVGVNVGVVRLRLLFWEFNYFVFGNNFIITDVN